VKCEWARKVLFELNDDFRIDDESCPGKKRFPKTPEEFPDYFEREFVICCCPTKGKKPHSEANKFKMLAKEEKERALFSISHDRRSREVTDLTSAELLEAH
jgi:hypothetical protein